MDGVRRTQFKIETANQRLGSADIAGEQFSPHGHLGAELVEVGERRLGISEIEFARPE